MLMPEVKRYMTSGPYSISSSDTLLRAKLLMIKHHIRHLPVVDGDSLVGILSERDLAVVEAVPGIDLLHVEVAKVMEPPFEVRSADPIDEVSAKMANAKRSCVVVQGTHGVEGIFTATDALQALSDVVRRATA